MAHLFVFDIDGTLLDSVPAHVSAFLKALALFDFEVVDQRWDAYPEHTDSAILRRLSQVNRGKPVTIEELDAFDRELDACFRESWPGSVADPFMPGAQHVVESIQRSTNAHVALATGGLISASLTKLETIAVIPPALMVTASDAEPRADIIRIAIERTLHHYGIGSTSQVTYVGDGPWDAIAARAIGIGFIGVGPSVERFGGQCPPDAIVASLDGIDITDWA
ncbi:MAG: HAD family hydrolase [Actinomycetota bacterium]